jgi:hypothetical protein
VNHLSSAVIIAVLSVFAFVGALQEQYQTNPPISKPKQEKQEQQEQRAAAAASTSAPAKTDTPKYEPTDSQAKDLKIAQLQAQLAQTQYATEAQKLPSFAQFQTAMQQLQSECKKVASENKWPGNVQCDVQQSPVKFCVGQLPCTAGK